MPKLAFKATLSVIDSFESGWGAVKEEKEFTLFILDEDMDDIIRFLKLQENSGVLIDGVTETVKHEMKKMRRCFVSTYSCFFGGTCGLPISKRCL